MHRLVGGNKLVLLKVSDAFAPFNKGMKNGVEKKIWTNFFTTEVFKKTGGKCVKRCSDLTLL